MVKKEITLRREELEGLSHDISVFFGGGTPTCFPKDVMEDFINFLQTELEGHNIVEFTCESNPKTMDIDYLRMLKGTKVDRLSIGFQSLIDEELKLLGRIHSSVDCTLALRDAKEAGFDNINVDMMIGIPNQEEDRYIQSLKEVIELGPEHISVYSLILEEGTLLFDDVIKKRVLLPPEDDVAAIYEAMVDILQSAGYMRYEVSNFAKPKRECVHNNVYWANDIYCGFGVAAHSHKARGIRTYNTESYEEYMKLLKEGRTPSAGYEELPIMMQVSDAFMLGLRRSCGIDLLETSKIYQVDVSKVYDKKIAKLVKLGLLERDGSIIRMTNKGFLLGNMVFGEFI